MSAAEASFVAELERARASSAHEPGYLASLRSWGRETFARVRLPTLKQEDWRYTNLAPLAERSFADARPDPGEVKGLPPAPRLVFLNGRLLPSACDLEGLHPRLRLSSLAETLRERPALLEPYLGARPARGDHAFLALNAALFEDGALLEIPDGVWVERPLHLLFVSNSGKPAASHPKNLVLAGRGARATVVEHYRGSGPYFVNAVTEVVLAEGAVIEHDRLQEDGPEAVHLGQLAVRQAAQSRFTGESFALGGQLARVELVAELRGEEASCNLFGLYVASANQLLDHLVEVDHASPHCTSREVYKGILDGTSRGVFAGRIRVREGAQRTDADQVNSNLLLSEEATIDTKPQLEILADDVKCSHGGSVGQIRDDQLFYLRTRGVPLGLARAMLTWAFASEMVDKLGPEGLRAHVGRAVQGRLPGGELLREVA
ncbi:MAG TPA: Fe-S cluster assembly protein SufD [Anaeromyxobacteraceae bacterium]|nr:Fe-S cluster assembly protein SufD [Anaeromyxobacteraceae bacterium]